jgi:hypothetical protein
VIQVEACRFVQAVRTHTRDDLNLFSYLNVVSRDYLLVIFHVLTNER